jgi:phosphoribosyl 1,2-cyclic phosphate phosphodiesterase
MTATLTILGCGSSGGVPRIGNFWGKCDPSNAKNRRRRCSILVRKTSDTGETKIVIDTSPDLREQMLAAGVSKIDGVLYTHEHADHTHGIDELRAFFLNQRKLVPVWADEITGQMLMSRFPYCFYTAPGSDYPPILQLNRITPGDAVVIDGAGGSIEALPFEVDHGNIRALGFRIGQSAYTPDLNNVPADATKYLENLDLWIVDALRYDRHPSHFSLDETLEWIDKLKPKRAVLTNMHIDLDFDTLTRSLPPSVEPAYDGLVLTI